MFNSIFETVEESISKLNYRSGENTQNKAQRETEWEIQKKMLQDLYGPW